jgi:hypothetical protein
MTWRGIVTIQKIAQEVYSTLSSEEKQYITNLPEIDLIGLYYGLGTTIRNQYLWNKSIPENASSPHTDDICAEIIKAIWEIATSKSGQEK